MLNAAPRGKKATDTGEETKQLGGAQLAQLPQVVCTLLANKCKGVASVCLGGQKGGKVLDGILRLCRQGLVETLIQYLSQLVFGKICLNLGLSRALCRPPCPTRPAPPLQRLRLAPLHPARGNLDYEVHNL